MFCVLRHQRLLIRRFCCSFVIVAPHCALAAIPVPPDLQPGDTYHLVFNSSLSTTALSSDIGFYNVVAQAAADVAGIGVSQGITWRALGSTNAVSARENAVVGAETPVYNMQRELLATGYADFWDGSLSASLAWNKGTKVAATKIGINRWPGVRRDGSRRTALGSLRMLGAMATLAKTPRFVRVPYPATWHP
jgi:hypothetical protein